MKVRQLHPGDEEIACEALTVLKTRPEGLAEHPQAAQLQELLGDPRNILIIALEGERPAGFITAYQMQRFDRPGTIVYFYEIGVAPDLRRQGIGAAMVRQLLDICRQRGVGSIWVGTSLGNRAAMRLFEATGARREPHDYIEFLYTLDENPQ